MAKRNKQEKGKQLDLIDVGPKHSKQIMAAALLYIKHQAARITSQILEKEQKTLILELVDKADMQRLAGGKIKFVLDGLTITITPRDELVQVKERTEPGE